MDRINEQIESLNLDNTVVESSNKSIESTKRGPIWIQNGLEAPLGYEWEGLVQKIVYSLE
jgi:hypothetical protein